eukprot:SAG11_NODE_16374_length_549_cov_1.017778_1_plen_183_part_11
MLYLYAMRLAKFDLLIYWVQSAATSLAIDGFITQPCIVCINARKAVQIARRQRNTAVAQGNASPFMQSLKHKHVWLLPFYIAPPNNPFNLVRRLACCTFFIAMATMANSTFLLLVVDGAEESGAESPENVETASRAVVTVPIILLVAGLAAVLTFPISKILVDMSIGLKEETNAIRDFGAPVA